MPRKSAEAISALRWRSGFVPPRPPVDLSPTAKKLWKEIAASKPADFWTPALCLLLRRLCRTAEFAERLADRLDQLAVGDPEALALGRQSTATNASIAGLATKMRLSAQNLITPHAREQMAETGGPIDPLLGGAAMRRERNGKSRARH